jgi:hypothetical protein
MSLTSKQKNYMNYLKDLKYEVSFSENKIIFTCPSNHQNILTFNSFANLKAKSKNNASLCSTFLDLF